MLRDAPLRVVTLGALLVVIAAPLLAFGVALHVASDADHDHELLASLAQLATHGHDHDVSTAPHDHPTLRSDGPQAPLPLIARAAGFAAAAGGAFAAGAPGFAEEPVPTGSPPLFRRHCALLL